MTIRILPIVALVGMFAVAEATLGSAAQPISKPPSEGSQATKKYRFYVRHMTGTGRCSNPSLPGQLFRKAHSSLLV